MQIVVFKLGDEHFAVETEKVQGINDKIGRASCRERVSSPV